MKQIAFLSGVLILVLWLDAFGQNLTKQVPKPYAPAVLAVSYANVAQQPPQKTPSNGNTTASLQGIPAGATTALAPEAAQINRFKDVPVNLYTGTPLIDLPLYTLQEAGLNVPVSLTYNGSGMKAGEVAGWSGLGWNLNAGGAITRVVRGLPDEGKLELDSWTGSTARSGYFMDWEEAYADGDNENDKEPDIFYVNLAGQSYKMMYYPFRAEAEQFVFFPEADIVVQPTYANLPGYARVGTFTGWVLTLPDGVRYYFGQDGAQEKTAEIEATFAKENDVLPESGSRFAHYWKNEAITSAWYLTKIVSPHGQSIDFEYRKARYSFFKLADNEASQLCPGSAVTKAINKVYVEGVVPVKISSSNVQIVFNQDCTTCSSVYDPLTGQLAFLCGLSDACVPPRLDVDKWTNEPANSSNTKKLVSIKVSDKTSGATDTLRYAFDYDHFESSIDPIYNPLPTGYSLNGAGGTTAVGLTHLRRLRLRSVTFPNNIKYEFSYHYENAPTTFYSRLSYGVDHWGYLNGGSGIPDKGLLAQDVYNNCAGLPSRNSHPDYAQYGLLSQIRYKNGYNLGMQTDFYYESHRAENYQEAGGGYLPIGGSRIKAIVVKDHIINKESTKRYTYLKPTGNQSSGFLTMKPIYTFHSIGPVGRLNSGLYERLLAETNRPIVGYSFVKEEESEGGFLNQGLSNGYTTYTFDQTETELGIGIGGQLCDVNGQNCAPFTFLEPQNFHPPHDFRSGNLRQTNAYNAANQLLSSQTLTYTTNGGIKTDSVLAKKVFRINGFSLGAETYEQNQKYYTVFRKYRTESQQSETYDENGQNPVGQTVELTYKDEMPLAYRQVYRGRHQQVVKTHTTDSKGQAIESLTKYVPDFYFGADSTFVPRTCSDASGHSFDCSYWLVVYHQPPLTNDAFWLYYGWVSQQYNLVVEQTQSRNGQAVGAGYVSYQGVNNSPGIVPKEQFVLQNIPQTTLNDAVYVNNDIAKDADYYSVSQLPDYNPLGLPTMLKATKGPMTQLTYTAGHSLLQSVRRNHGAADVQVTSYDYQTRMFGASKVTAPNLLETRYDYHPDSRLKTVRDGLNNVLESHQYFNSGETDPSGTVAEDFIYFYRHLSRRPRVATSNPWVGASEALIDIGSYAASGGRHNRRLYRQSPIANTDIVTDWTDFDAFKRPISSDLPFANDDPAIGADEYALYPNYAPAAVTYEAGPLGRPRRSFGPGQVWRTANRSGQYHYGTAGSEVRKYEIQPNGTVNGSSSYADFVLFRESVQDERGLWAHTFTDKEGRTLEQWVQDTTDAYGQPQYLKTAYVYDDLGRLRYILPPAVYVAVTDFSEADAVFANGIYAYRYDGRGRVIEKHTPNAGWTYTIYNYLNQPVLIQDARQRTQNLWQWVKSDGHGRVVQRGTWTNAASRQTLQAYFDAHTEDKLFEERGAALLSYTHRSLPPQINLNENDVKAEYFYDDYGWASQQVGFSNDAYAVRYESNVGLATGSKLRNTENDAWFETAFYYDYKNRVLQSKSTHHLGGTDQVDYDYNFVGEILKERKIFRRTGASDLTTITTYTRDHTGRITASKHTLNGTEKNIGTYEYDEIGRLKRKKVNPFALNITRTATPPDTTQDIATQWVELLPNFSITATENNTYVACITPRDALQTIDYNYHIRGTVNCVNCADGNPSPNVAENDLFSMRLYFEEDGRYYNGQISKQSWLTNTSSPGVRSYTYTYDMADRLKAAAYGGVGNENYSLSGVSYDRNGNIQTLQRFGQTGTGTWGAIDNLTYHYDTKINQLLQVTDAVSGNLNVGDFRASGSNYAYWADGSLRSDLNKGITEIDYNYLGLPQRVSFGDSRWIDFFYDAEGHKYKQLCSDGREYHYLGDVLYFKAGSAEPLKIYEIQHDEGRVVSNGTGLVYEYGYYDHLGNLRVSYIDSAGVAIISQQNDYDPWGVALTGLNRASRFVNDNFHTFNGQEQLEFGYQNMGWRWMDNLTGRMSGIDPMHQFDSDYTALGNQPTMRIDPDGQFAPLIVYGVAALVGGGINLASNWSKVKDWKSGGAYFLSGAVGGVVAVTNPFAGGAITSTSNAVIDIATGNLPNLQSPSDYATYLGKEALIGGVSSYAGAQIGKLVGPQLGKVFHWSQQTFANATQQTIQIGGQNYSYAVDAGVKLSKSWVGAAGSSAGRSVTNEIVKRPSRYNKGVVDQVWKNSQNAEGKVFDPTSGQEILWNGSKPRNWDMGHISGKEWFRLRDKYLNGDITWKELLKEYNNPANYRPELPSFNRANNKF